MANLRYCDSFKSCLLKHECKSGKLDGDKMGHISKIGLPGSCCCQPEERNILGLRLIIFQKTFSATAKYTDIYSGCGHVCWSKHQESLWVWCGAGIDQEYCEAYSQHAIYSFAKVTSITSIDVVRISFAFRIYFLFFFFRYDMFAYCSLYNVQMCLRANFNSLCLTS